MTGNLIKTFFSIVHYKVGCNSSNQQFSSKVNDFLKITQTQKAFFPGRKTL